MCFDLISARSRLNVGRINKISQSLARNPFNLHNMIGPHPTRRHFFYCCLDFSRLKSSSKKPEKNSKWYQLRELNVSSPQHKMENFATNWKSFIQIGKGRRRKKKQKRKKICLLKEKWMQNGMNSMRRVVSWKFWWRWRQGLWHFYLIWLKEGESSKDEIDFGWLS